MSGWDAGRPWGRGCRGQLGPLERPEEGDDQDVVADTDVGGKNGDMDGSTDMDLAPEDCHSSQRGESHKTVRQDSQLDIDRSETWLDRLT